MHLKVLDRLLPPYSVAALAAIKEHLPVAEHFCQRSQSGATVLPLFPPLLFSPLVAAFSPFLTVHNKSIRLSYRCGVGCRLICFALTHETGIGTYARHARSVRARASKERVSAIK